MVYLQFPSRRQADAVAQCLLPLLYEALRDGVHNETMTIMTTACFIVRCYHSSLQTISKCLREYIAGAKGSRPSGQQAPYDRQPYVLASSGLHCIVIS